MVRISLAICACFLFVLACTPKEQPPPPAKDSYSLSLKFTPQKPIPGQPATLEVEVKNQDGEVIQEGSLGLSAQGVGAGIDMSLKAEGGKFMASQVIFDKEGSWELVFKLTLDGEDHEIKKTLEVACQGDKSSGSVCCQDSHCSDGLSCVYGSCSATKAAADAPCYTNGGCDSGTCKAGKCVAATCDDELKNGKETDTDCGGGCTPCQLHLACKQASDCKSGVCSEGKCGPGPGELIGAIGGRKEANWKTITSDFRSNPADLAFHTDKKEQLWVVEPTADAIVVVFNPGGKDQRVQRVQDTSQHFLEQVIGISFSDNNTFGTCGDNRNSYGGLRQPNDFMGPVLWLADINDLLKGRRGAYERHLDMLHSTPLCMGIAAETKNRYFVFNGLLGTIDWYDFKQPHVPGGSDHKDGFKRRFSEVKVKRVARLPSNLHYDAKTKWLYIADTGNGRVLRINVSDAKDTNRLFSFPEDGILMNTQGVKIEELVKPGTVSRPTGLTVHNDTIYVNDNATSLIYAFDLKGQELNRKDMRVEKGSLGGLTVGPDARLYTLDMKGRRLLRIDP